MCDVITSRVLGFFFHKLVSVHVGRTYLQGVMLHSLLTSTTKKIWAATDYVLSFVVEIVGLHLLSHPSPLPLVFEIMGPRL